VPRTAAFAALWHPHTPSALCLHPVRARRRRMCHILASQPPGIMRIFCKQRQSWANSSHLRIYMALPCHGNGISAGKLLANAPVSAAAGRVNSSVGSWSAVGAPTSAPLGLITLSHRSTGMLACSHGQCSPPCGRQASGRPAGGDTAAHGVRVLQATPSAGATCCAS